MHVVFYNYRNKHVKLPHTFEINLSPSNFLLLPIVFATDSCTKEPRRTIFSSEKIE